MLNVVVLNVIMLNVEMLNVTMLNVTMLNVVILSVVMPSRSYNLPTFFFKFTRIFFFTIFQKYFFSVERRNKSLFDETLSRLDNHFNPNFLWQLPGSLCLKISTAVS
jgi:hypothetical protein